ITALRPIISLWVAAVPVTLSLMSGTVFAAAEDKPNVTLNTNELSLYTTPQQKFRYLEPDIGHLEPGVTTLRKLAEPYVTWCQSCCLQTISNIRPTTAYCCPIRFSLSCSRVKKLIYPTGLMAAGHYSEFSHAAMVTFTAYEKQEENSPAAESKPRS
uniref:Uncharacterized protein n=1 Tax=Oncorhynchus kisutch TaxID=8019 RepID=A0A8C7JM49_ONCKI